MARSPRTPKPDPGFTVETLLNNSTVKITRTTMQADSEIPQQARPLDYVIFPVTEYTCLRKFSRDGLVRRQVQIEGKPGKPYFVKASSTGAEFSLENTSKCPIVFDKIVMKKPKTS